MANKERRKQGCDGCHGQVPTERFDGFMGSTLWLCSMCRKELIKNGLHFKYKSLVIEKRGKNENNKI